MESSSPSVLIVRLDAIGDALTTVPLVAALRRYGWRVGAVLRPVNAAVFSAAAFERIHVADGAGIGGEIRAAKYDCALIPTEKAQAYRIARDARIPVRVGFENGWGKPLKTLWVRRMCTETIFRTAGLDPRAPHECEVVFKLAHRLLPHAEPPREPALLRPIVLDREPAPDARIAIQVTDKWERLGAQLQDVEDLIRRIAARHTVRLIGAQTEWEYCDRVSSAVSLPVETFSALADWKASIAAAKALVAPDSGAVHVAGMTGTRVVACFSPKHFALQTARWSPWAAPNRIVKIEEPWPLVAADALEFLLTDSPRAIYKG
jgi:ADP-heptose:LPS heptosyltransferase